MLDKSTKLGSSMKKKLKIAGFGIILWIVSFLACMFLYSRGGKPIIDVSLIEIIILFLSSLVSAYLVVICLKELKTGYLKQGIIIGFIWLFINVLLDLLNLIPVSKNNHLNLFCTSYSFEKYNVACYGFWNGV